MIVQAGLDAVCSTLQRPLCAGDLLQPVGARCAPFAAGALLLQMNREVLSFCRSSAPRCERPPEPPPLCCRSSAPLRKPPPPKPSTSPLPCRSSAPLRKAPYHQHPRNNKPAMQAGLLHQAASLTAADRP